MTWLILHNSFHVDFISENYFPYFFSINHPPSARSMIFHRRRPHFVQSKRHLSLLAITSLQAAAIYIFAASSSSSYLVALSFIFPTSPLAIANKIKTNKVHHQVSSAASSPLSRTFHTTPLPYNKNQSIRRSYSSSNSKQSSILQSSSSDNENSNNITMSDNNNDNIPNLQLLDKSTLHNLVEYATSFSAANGLQVASSSSNNKNYITAPISLLPQSYPLQQFHHAKKLAIPFNILVDRISRDGEFIKETLRDVRDVDLYTGKLLELYEEIYLGKRGCCCFIIISCLLVE